VRTNIQITFDFGIQFFRGSIIDIKKADPRALRTKGRTIDAPMPDAPPVTRTDLPFMS
jgi:hypothetical protein